MLPSIKANALYGGGYPLFTALARPLIAAKAVEVAAEHGCDTIAHGCTGKGNDQVRLEATIATLDPELKVLAPVRDWRMGRDEELAVRARQRDPAEGRQRGLALLDRRQPLGPLIGGQGDRGPDGAAARRRLPARHPARGGARRAAAAEGRVRAGEAGRPRRRADGAGRPDRPRHRDRRAPRLRDRRPHRGPDRRPQGPRPLRGPGRRDPDGRAPRPREARLDDPPEQLQGRALRPLGLPRLRRASGSSRSAATSTPSWSRPTRS